MSTDLIKQDGETEFQAVAVAEVAQGNGHAPGMRRAKIVETFPWRPDGEGAAVVEIRVHPYRFKADQGYNVDRRVSDVTVKRQVLNDERSKLLLLQGTLNNNLRLAEMTEEDEPEGTRAKLEKIEARLKEVEEEITAIGNPWDIRLSEILCKMIAKPFEYDGLTIEPTPESLRQLDPDLLNKLQSDILGFTPRAEKKSKTS